MTLIINAKEITNHHTVTSCQEVAEMMLPQLSKHGITIFNYYKTYFDGSGVRFSTHRAWSERYLEKGYNLNTTVPSSYLTKPLNYFVWLIKDCPPMLIDAATNFDIANGITIAHRNEDSIECYAFGAKVNNTSIVNFYLNNPDKLHNYCHFFKEQANTLLNVGEKNKIILTMNDINNENISLPKMLTLSDRQFECATLLLSGMKYKEIGRQLNLSARTVEHYIDMLKAKLDCHHINELIIKLTKISCL
jgi:LuxR family transcriptional regulator, quorum-sensing system regulator SolR